MTPTEMLKVNVNEHTEQKNGLTYLSWSWAWAECLKADPNASWTLHLFEDKLFSKVPYMTVMDTAMVMVDVMINGQTRTCQLPVMDNRNAPISLSGVKVTDKYGKEKVVRVDAFSVNTAIMRCLVKAIAMHGLGLYIYSGEDLPEQDKLEEKPVVRPNHLPVPNPDDPAPVQKPVKEKPTAEEKKEATKAIKAENEARDKPADPPEAWPLEALGLFVKAFFEHAALNSTQESLVDYAHQNKASIELMKENLPDMHKAFMAKYRETKAKLPSTKEAK
jgi:hypothetical protein